MEFGAGVRVGAGITMGGDGINRRPLVINGLDLSALNIPPIVNDSSLVLYLEPAYFTGGQTYINQASTNMIANLSLNASTNYVNVTAPFGYPNKEGSYFDLGVEDTTRYIELPGRLPPRPSAAVTIEAFAYQTSWTSAVKNLYTANASGGGGMILGHNSGGFSGAGANYYFMAINGTVPTDTGIYVGDLQGKWFHLAATYDYINDPYSRIYLNGVLKSSYAISSSGITQTAFAPHWINGDNTTSVYNPPDRRAGRVKLGPLRMYTRALTAAEIKNNYDAQKYRYGLT